MDHLDASECNGRNGDNLEVGEMDGEDAPADSEVKVRWWVLGTDVSGCTGQL
jgi:hypothetical protein